MAIDTLMPIEPAQLIHTTNPKELQILYFNQALQPIPMKLQQEMTKFQNGLKIIDEKDKIKHQLLEKIRHLKRQLKTIIIQWKTYKPLHLPSNGQKLREVWPQTFWSRKIHH